jgi:hypothetical protein
MSNMQKPKPKTVDSEFGKVPLNADGIPNLDAWEREDIDRPPFQAEVRGKVWTFKHPKDLPISNLKMLLQNDPELMLATIVSDEDRADMLLLDLSFGQLEVLGSLYEAHHGLDRALVGNGSASPS